MMIATLLVAASAGIILLLGLIHLTITFSGSKLDPRSATLKTSMQEISPAISKETTMWKAWIGFNASHSMGAILFGLVYGYLALAQGALLFHSPYLLVVGLAMLLGLVALGKAYWFSIPFIGIGIALACYLAGVVVSRL
jgi:hypothetical protein